uniref:translation initiation factor IF-2-like n=1 Tax=Nyctereutes procyonoides TaxID=34880 RepID=UPI0024438AA4|nr:translation initiation factor IF-2-like [Nyctereutes procyonoides]XP_055191516.1 translation initiation factor IF-2-like [Nyctereutes procyonoides]XP_055191517.1 translation initiation factor IF-2-like [Nyctereutes procyonoides]XP_055191518.1 translation initiation factor IF-2-like [Nyctereutes procyonoides]XP_055191519.1 translation initiation factor IF-2-like [Nyctereutes procyonoides]
MLGLHPNGGGGGKSLPETRARWPLKAKAVLAHSCAWHRACWGPRWGTDPMAGEAGRECCGKRQGTADGCPGVNGPAPAVPHPTPLQHLQHPQHLHPMATAAPVHSQPLQYSQHLHPTPPQHPQHPHPHTPAAPSVPAPHTPAAPGALSAPAAPSAPTPHAPAAPGALSAPAAPSAPTPHAPAAPRALIAPATPSAPTPHTPQHPEHPQHPLHSQHPHPPPPHHPEHPQHPHPMPLQHLCTHSTHSPAAPLHPEHPRTRSTRVALALPKDACTLLPPAQFRKDWVAGVSGSQEAGCRRFGSEGRRESGRGAGRGPRAGWKPRWSEWVPVPQFPNCNRTGQEQSVPRRFGERQHIGGLRQRPGTVSPRAPHRGGSRLAPARLCSRKTWAV